MTIIMAENPRITTSTEVLVDIFGLNIDQPDFELAIQKAEENGWDRWKDYFQRCKAEGKLVGIVTEEEVTL